MFTAAAWVRKKGWLSMTSGDSHTGSRGCRRRITSVMITTKPAASR
jgi:hypothetical protein